MRSAPMFQLVVMPFASMVKIAKSVELSTTSSNSSSFAGATRSVDVSLTGGLRPNGLLTHSFADQRHTCQRVRMNAGSVRNGRWYIARITGTAVLASNWQTHAEI